MYVLSGSVANGIEMAAATSGGREGSIEGTGGDDAVMLVGATESAANALMKSLRFICVHAS